MIRPQSVTVLAILQLISGIFSLLDGLFILLFAGIFGGLGAAFGGAKVGAVIGGFIGIFAAISFILGFLSLLLTWGLFQLKNWAWTGTLNCPYHRHPRANCQIVWQRRYSSQFFNSGFCSG